MRTHSLAGTRLLHHCWVILLALAVGGCVSTHFTAPQVRIISVSMVSGDLLNQQFRLRLNVDNPNDRALPIASIQYQLSIRDDAFAEGRTEQSFVVPAHGQAQFDTLVNTQLLRSLDKLAETLSSRNAMLPYKISGEVQLSRGWLRRVPFNSHGAVALSETKSSSY